MDKFKNISVYGGGSWGTALACQVARCYDTAPLFLRNNKIVDEILTYGTNNKYLGDIILPSNINPSNELSSILSQEVIIIAIPSTAFTDTIHTLREARLSPNIVLLIATKGFGSNPTELLSDRVKSILPKNPVAFITGPNFAKEVAQNLLTPVTIACQDIHIATKLANSLTTEEFIVTTTTDIVTLQIAGAVKNIIAIQSGLYEAAKYGKNAKAWLITEALKEIRILSEAFNPMSDNSILFEPGVLGDLLLTCYSLESRNTKFGYELGMSQDTNKFLKENSYLVEGRESVKLILDFIKKYNLSLPIISSVAKRLKLL